jgi:hypothetical protein
MGNLETDNTFLHLSAGVISFTPERFEGVYTKLTYRGFYSDNPFPICHLVETAEV